MGLISANFGMYMVFANMRQRCNNSTNHAFRNYGGRGITIDPRWDCFKQFLADMSPRPDGCVIDRIDNDKGYSPENCRWVTVQQNNLNTRLRKANKTGVRNIRKTISGSFCVQIRRFGVTVLTKTTSDFFEACCILKSFYNKENQKWQA